MILSEAQFAFNAMLHRTLFFLTTPVIVLQGMDYKVLVENGSVFL